MRSSGTLVAPVLVLAHSAVADVRVSEVEVTVARRRLEDACHDSRSDSAVDSDVTVLFGRCARRLRGVVEVVVRVNGGHVGCSRLPVDGLASMAV